MKSRFHHIDFLRAIAIIGVVATHVYSYNLTNNISQFVWNYLHFLVPGFIFCSGYVMAAGYKNKFTSIFSSMIWIKKRITRLIIPFYIYLIVHYLLLILFPDYFSGLGLEKSFNFLIDSALLIGGINLNWLVLLFIELGLLFPIFINIFNKKKMLYGYIFFASIITIFFTVQTNSYDYFRYVMWIPWSLIFLLAIYFYNMEQKKIDVKKYLLIAGVSLLIFGSLFFLWNLLNKSFNLIDYKYPPSLYYLSYALGFTFIFLTISQIKIFKKNALVKIYSYLSQISYPLYFVHYIVLDFVIKTKTKFFIPNSPSIQFIIVLTLSIFLIYSYNNLFKRLNFNKDSKVKMLLDLNR